MIHSIVSPISKHAEELMKGPVRKLVPLSEFKGPVLKLTQRAKSTIWQYEKLIHRDLKMIEDLEVEKSALGLSSSKIAEIENRIKRLLASIAENKDRIRSIKIDNYKGQILDETV